MISLIEEVITLLNMMIRFPMRIICILQRGHDGKYYDSSFIYVPKYPFVCKKCGCRSKGEYNDLIKKGFKGITKDY